MFLLLGNLGCGISQENRHFTTMIPEMPCFKVFLLMGPKAQNCHIIPEGLSYIIYIYIYFFFECRFGCLSAGFGVLSAGFPKKEEKRDEIKEKKKTRKEKNVKRRRSVFIMAQIS